MQPEHMYLLKKQNYNFITSTRPILSFMHKLPVMLDTGACRNFLRDGQLAQFQKSQITHVTRTMRIHYANDGLLSVVDCLKLYVHLCRLLELLTFIVWEQLNVPATLECDYCDYWFSVPNRGYVSWSKLMVQQFLFFDILKCYDQQARWVRNI